MPSHPPTPSTITRAKRDAKILARKLGITHSQALELEARRLGFASWHALITGPADAPSRLPVDPLLPNDFEHTPNDERPLPELDTWWDRPYAITCTDGTFDVLCLNGGAWDRPTWLGNAPTLEEAAALAKRRQERWLSFRARPLASLEADGSFSVVQTPQRPDMSPLVLAAGLDAASAEKWIVRWAERHPAE